ncbi:hypothetical protein [Elizabethkingia meningoseptica]|uniref:hypothetical protein n=1 Tax=Elizabethkingia meningoseptica TaxID=238 RepID=UPI0016244AEB|nr:hypothetical protein [Elizabethkingia meningoseptica]HAY3553741.1 hypothetical protein [Elizabethkingia meningoseptica]
MAKRQSFTEQAKSEMPSFIKKAIDDLLDVMDSNIVYPKNKNGQVLETKLLTIVKAREDVYNELCGLMDLISIDKSSDTKYKSKIIQGLKTTWHELTRITCRSIGGESTVDFTNYTQYDEPEEDLECYGSRQLTSDDNLSSIAKSKGLSARVATKIIERLELLEDKESVQRQKIENKKIGGIPERFAKVR